jgi:copper chaperone CopZ
MSLVPRLSFLYPESVPTTTLNIDGMNCGHCVQSITKAIETLPGVRKAEVSLETHSAVVHHADDSSVDAMIAAVEEEGYGASRG